MSNELTSALEGMAHDRGIDTQSLLSLVEESVATGISRAEKWDQVSVKFNHKTGEMEAFFILTVVERVTDPSKEISFAEASLERPSIKIGDEYRGKVPSSVLSRIVAQTTGQIIRQRLRIAEKQNVCKDFEDLKGQLITGIVRGIERGGDVRIDFGRAEGIMPRKERVGKEDYGVGDNITVLLLDIYPEGSGPSLIVSRTHPNFIKCLFEREISEIRDGTIEVKAVAREPGMRSKVAVRTNNERIDPIGACVGIRGGRIKTILKEIGDEKIDIILWNENPKIFVTNALQPAKLKTIEIDEANHQVLATVTEDQLSLAIGKKGQNAKLAVMLTGWRIRITQAENHFVSTADIKAGSFEVQKSRAIEVIANIPGIDEKEAKLLVENGFMSAEGIVDTDCDYLASLQGIDTTERAEEIIEAACQFING